LFVNRVLSATANLSANISVVSRQNVYADLFDTFSTLETVGKRVGKLVDLDIISTSEAVAITFSAAINNTDSTVSFTESISGLRYTVDYSDPTYFSELYVSSGSEVVI
jgi:hypothetical protein